jgi:hypothetical protein
MTKFVLASLLGAAVMFAGQAPATPSKAQTPSSQPAPATTTKVKKHHHKKGTKAPVSTTSTNSKPVAKQ